MCSISITTQYYNRTEKRDGALFRGRYKAILVDQQTYWAQLSRYIHRNPLEAKMVKQLGLYRWSSYPAYLGKVKRPDWLVCDYILKSIATHDRRLRYQAYVAEENDEEIEKFYAQKKQPPVLSEIPSVILWISLQNQCG